MSVSIDIKVDAKQVMVGLDAIGKAIPIVANNAIKQELEAAKKKITTYPLRLSGQKYQRTGTYGRAFSISPMSKGLFNTGYTLTGQAIEAKRGREYTKYVGGLSDGSGQASIHQKRWPVIYNEAMAAGQRVVARMETGLAGIINKVGLGIGRVFGR